MAKKQKKAQAASKAEAEKLYVGTRKGLFTLAPAGSDWTVEAVDFLAEPVTAILPDRRDGTLYAALRHGHFGVKLHRRSVGGEWEEVAAPRFPVEVDDGEDAPSVDTIWALEAGAPEGPGTLWAGTVPGAVFTSPDGGESWELNRGLWDLPARKKWFGGGYDQPGAHSVCVDPRDPEHVIVGVSCGGAWRTRDGGESWESSATGMEADYVPPDQAKDPDIQDPHIVVQCPAEPGTLWTQHHCGIFVSTDEAASWQRVRCKEPSSFGFAVAVHPQEPKTAWFVPAVKDECRVPKDGRLVVTRTRNGGESFDVLRDGLPQEHAYDLVFRHALDVAPDGDRLAFGSTTGNLFATADQGDTWSRVSSTLPPVYVVRFG